MITLITKALVAITLTATLQIHTAEAVSQLHKRLVCGRVIHKSSSAPRARTVVSLYFGEGGFDQLVPGALTQNDGTFCIEDYVSDLNKSTSARLYVTSFCGPNAVTLVNVPFWPQMRKVRMFSGKRITVGPGDRTDVGDVGVQVNYGQVSLRILDYKHRPLLTDASNWSALWIRVRNQHGSVVHEGGLSIADIERAVEFNQSRINLALPQGTWTLEVALTGDTADASTIRPGVSWQKVPQKLLIKSCREPMEVTLLATESKKSQ